MSAPLVLPVGVRGFMPLTQSRSTMSNIGRIAKRHRPAELLVLGTLARSDLGQHLAVACYRHYVGTNLVDEGLIVPDDASTDEHSCLVRYTTTHMADLPPGYSRMGLGRRLRLLTRTDFLRTLFYPLAYRRHGLVVGFNLAFDLSRLADHITSRPDDTWRFGMLGSMRQDRTRPRWVAWPGCPDVLVAPRGDDAVAISFASQSPFASHWVPTNNGTRIKKSAVSKDPRGGQWRGALVSLAQVITALSGQSFTLQSACRAFGLDDAEIEDSPDRVDEEPLAHCRSSVRATAELYRAIQPDLASHGDANVEPQHIYSGASFARGYWRSSGIDSAPKIDPQLVAYGAAAFSGGRIEARIVRSITPVVVVDRPAAYVRDAALLGIEELLAAEQIDTRDATAAFVRFIEGGNLLTRTANTETCRWLARLFVKVRPDGEPWHVRAWFQDRSAPSLVTAPFSFAGLWWVTAFDVVTAILLEGRVPQVRQVLELVPHGQRERRPVRISGGAPVEGDLLTACLHRQAELEVGGEYLAAFGLKPLRNSAAFGLLAQVTRLVGKPARRVIFGPDGPLDVAAVEEIPGNHTCLPLAAAITAFARFLLARIEAKFTALGGLITAMDTDSAVTVATKEGGLVPCPGGPHRLPDGREAIRALSFDEVRSVFDAEAWVEPPGDGTPWREKFDTFGEPAFLYAICNKRTVIFRRGPDGEVVLLDASEILLGGRYLSPTGSEEAGRSGARSWVEEAWRHLIDPERHPRPSWWEVPAIRRVTLRSPRTLHRFGEVFDLRPYGFFCQGELAPRQRGSTGAPVCRFSADSSEWRGWRDPKTGARVEPLTEAELARGKTGEGPVIATLGGVLERWAATVDDRYEACAASEHARGPVGLLRPRQITSMPALVELIGKESSLWGEAFVGEVEPDDPDWLSLFGTVGDPWTEVVLPALARIGVTEVAHHGKLHERKVYELLAGRARPRPKNRTRLIEFAYSVAIGSLGRKSPLRTARGAPSERAMLAVIATWLRTDVPPARICERAGCTEPLQGRKRYCSDRCRKAARRTTERAALRAVGAVRCRHCGAVRYGSSAAPCPACGDRSVTEVSAVICPDCGTERVGDTSGPCPTCGDESA